MNSSNSAGIFFLYFVFCVYFVFFKFFAFHSSIQHSYCKTHHIIDWLIRLEFDNIKVALGRSFIRDRNSAVNMCTFCLKKWRFTTWARVCLSVCVCSARWHWRSDGIVVLPRSLCRYRRRRHWRQQQPRWSLVAVHVVPCKLPDLSFTRKKMQFVVDLRASQVKHTDVEKRPHGTVLC